MRYLVLAALLGLFGLELFDRPSASVWVSVDGNDASCVRGDRSLPCATFQRALEIARTGQVVEVTGGRYPAQTITEVHKPATLRAARDAEPRVDGVFSLTCTTGLAIENIDSEQLGIYAGNAALQITGSRHGEGSYTINVEKDPIVIGNIGSCPRGDTSRDIVLDRLHVGAYRYPGGDAGIAHPDCLQIFGGVDGLTVRGSTFQDCEDSFIGAFPDVGNIYNVTIENNTFANLGNRTYSASQWGQSGHPFQCRGITIRNNVWRPNNPNALAPFSSLRTDCAKSTVVGNSFQNGPGQHSCDVWQTSYGNLIWSNNTFLRGNRCVLSIGPAAKR